MPTSYLFVLFIGIPLVELALLLKLHEWVGLGYTIALVFITGIVGVSLVKRQGISIIHEIQIELEQGRLPAPQLMDGIMILIAGAFLITPGILTDTVGFLLLIPLVRYFVRMQMKHAFEKKINNGSIEIEVDDQDIF